MQVKNENISSESQASASGIVNPMNSSPSSYEGQLVSSETESETDINLERHVLMEVTNTSLVPLLNVPGFNIGSSGSQTTTVERIVSTFKRKFIPDLDQKQLEDVREKATWFEEIMRELKNKFKSTDDKDEMYLILTILPKSWSTGKIEKEFETSRRVAEKAKELQSSKGVLSKPDSKIPSNILEPETQKMVQDFYEDIEISREMPGLKDYVSIKESDKREQKQKRMMLCTLEEAYQEFKKRYPATKVGLTKFVKYRPKFCVFLGSSGTHAVCVCTIHQNVKLMLFGGQLAYITDNQLVHYTDYIKIVLCTSPEAKCYLGKCHRCPGITSLETYLKSAFKKHDLEEEYITFQQWVSTDRCNLETYSKIVPEFIEYFLKKIEKLIPHVFITKQQSTFVKDLKVSLCTGEFLVCCDFSENYSFILQNEAQGYHWNNNQATIHPFVVYFNENNDLHHFSYIMISECLHHDSVAVKLFLSKLIIYMKTRFQLINKLIYLTDGAASQYKNRKNFSTVYNHKRDFGYDCEWHFHATAHGKGPCDGIGGTFKRKARNESLSRAYTRQIINAKLLYEWAKDSGMNMEFSFSSNREYDQLHESLENEFGMAKQIKGTQQLHCIIPDVDNKLKVKKFSKDLNYELVNIF